MGLTIATIEDKDVIVSMAIKFAMSTDYKDFIDETRIGSIVEELLTAPNEQKIILLYEDKGMLAGIATPFVFGTKFVATELAWWVEPEHRASGVGKELLTAFEYWAKQIGCSAVSMVSIDDTLGNYLEHRGYKLSERAYLKKMETE